MLPANQRKMIAQAACIKRSFIIGIGAILLLYLTACCALYFRNIDTFLTRSLFRSSDTLLSTTSTPLSEEEEKLRIRAELGHGVWNMLHRMAAQYEKNPTPKQKADIIEFFNLLGTFYPCTECAAHFREMLKEHPVEPDNNKQLSLWLCRVHNIVNERLGKPSFECTLENLKERYGSCGCFDDDSKDTDQNVETTDEIRESHSQDDKSSSNTKKLRKLLKK